MAEAQEDETPRQWFDRSIAARFDYLPAYRALRVALWTRWSGDPGALLAFAHECAATRRFDTEVPLQAFRAVEDMEWEIFAFARYPGDIEDPEEARRIAAAAVLPPSPYKDPAVYDLVSTVLMRYRRNPGNARWQRYASYQVVVDYKAERYEDAGKVLEDLSGVLEPDAREEIGGTFPEARIHALASPCGADAGRAEALYKAGKVAEALPLFEKARASAPSRALPYLDQRLASARTEADLAAGRTVAPFAGGGLGGWTPVHGTWAVDAEGALVGTSDAAGHLITGDARVGPDVEVSADIEVASTSNGQFQSGIILGRDISIRSRDWLSFRVKRTAHEGDVVYFSQNFFQAPRVIPHLVQTRSHVVVQSWNGRLWAYVDGKPVVAEYTPEWKMPRGPEVQVGFGAYVNDNVTVIRYRNVRLRRLTAPPVLPAATAAAVTR